MGILTALSVFVTRRWVKDTISSLITVLVMLSLTMDSMALNPLSVIAFIWIGASFWLISSGVLTLLGAYALPSGDASAGPWKLAGVAHLVLGTVLLVLGVIALSVIPR